MRGKIAKSVRELAYEGLNEVGKGYPDKKWGVRKIKTTFFERYQVVVHPQCMRYQFLQLKKFVKNLQQQQATTPKPVKNVGFGSRRKRRGQAMRSSIPKFSRQGEVIHNV